MKDEISKKMWAHPSHVSFVWLWGENRPLSSTIKELKARKILMRQLCWRKGGAVMFPRRYVQQSANQQMHLWCWVIPHQICFDGFRHQELQCSSKLNYRKIVQCIALPLFFTSTLLLLKRNGPKTHRKKIAAEFRHDCGGWNRYIMRTGVKHLPALVFIPNQGCSKKLRVVHWSVAGFVDRRFSISF